MYIGKLKDIVIGIVSVVMTIGLGIVFACTYGVGLTLVLSPIFFPGCGIAINGILYILHDCAIFVYERFISVEIKRVDKALTDFFSRYSFESINENAGYNVNSNACEGISYDADSYVSGNIVYKDEYSIKNKEIKKLAVFTPVNNKNIVEYKNQKWDRNRRFDTLFAKKQYEMTPYFKATGEAFDFVFYDKSPEGIGARGEYAASLYYDEITTYHKVLYNVFLPYTIKKTGEVRTTEVDAVIISRNGVFVVEVKNRNGYFEVENERAEVAYIHNGDMIREIKNPFVQNMIHINTIKKMMKEYKFSIKNHNEDIVRGVLVMGPESMGYKVVNAENKQDIVSYDKIAELIDGNRKYVYTVEEVDSIYSTFLYYQNNIENKKIHEKMIEEYNRGA